MWTYDRTLEYPVNITKPNAKLAKVIISQFGGPDGELGASQRYLSQRYSNGDKRVCGILTDIGISVMKLHMGDCPGKWGLRGRKFLFYFIIFNKNLDKSHLPC